MWIRELLKELKFSVLYATLIQQDNQSTIALAKNPIHHRRTKHIDTQHHFIRECIKNETISLEYMPTERMIADSLTKPLPRGKFEQSMKEMGITSISMTTGNNK